MEMGWASGCKDWYRERERDDDSTCNPRYPPFWPRKVSLATYDHHGEDFLVKHKNAHRRIEITIYINWYKLIVSFITWWWRVLALEEMVKKWHQRSVSSQNQIVYQFSQLKPVLFKPTSQRKDCQPFSLLSYVHKACLHRLASAALSAAAVAPGKVATSQMPKIAKVLHHENPLRPDS